MSVPVNMRSHGKLEVCVKAHDLCCYTLKITSNKKIFVTEYQTSLTDKINTIDLDIWSNVWTANNILVKTKTDAVERLKLQQEAARMCNVLLSMIDVAAKIFHLASNRIQYWGGKVIDTRNMIRAWRESDKKRYENI